jgi:hypothetical protein
VQHDAPLANAERTECEAGGIGAVEDIRIFSVPPLDQRSPPSAAGEQRRSWGGKERYRPTDGQDGPQMGRPMYRHCRR